MYNTSAELYSTYLRIYFGQHMAFPDASKKELGDKYNPINLFLDIYNYDDRFENGLIPFMSASLKNVIKRIIKMFILLGVIEKANTSNKLINVDLAKADTCLPPELTMLGTTTNENLKSLHVSNKTKLKFRKHCLRFLKALVQKLQERYLLKYSFIRSAIWLSTIFMVAEPKAAKVHFNHVVEKSYLVNWMTEKSDKVRNV